MLAPLTDTEKAYFDTIKQVAAGARPRDLALWRMTLDGRDVAVVMQRIINRHDATEAGWQPLAVLLDDDTIERLRTHTGDAFKLADASDVEGAA